MITVGGMVSGQWEARDDTQQPIRGQHMMWGCLGGVRLMTISQQGAGYYQYSAPGHTGDWDHHQMSGLRGSGEDVTDAESPHK